jgi:hypothetical protein
VPWLSLAVISRCPEDPSKTQITIIAHANPGGGLPPWAAKTAVNALAPIEPFKLFHKINENVKRNQPELRERLREAEMVSNMPPGRSPRPGGIAQLGYACFWPKGGGSIEGSSTRQTHSPGQIIDPTPHAAEEGSSVEQHSPANTIGNLDPTDTGNNYDATSELAVDPEST